MALQYPDIIESSNPKAYGIVKAKEVSGHKTVESTEDLYDLADCILSESGDNTGNDAIGQEWYVSGEQAKYRLIDWGNRKSSSGWKKLEDAINITIDSSISDVSENPVQNKVIKSELDKKQDTLSSGTNIKTINGETILGSGDITIESGISEAPEDGKKYVRSNGDWVEETKIDTSPFATKEELEGKVDDSEISDMLTKTEASSTYATKSEVTEGLETKQDKGDYALKSEIPDISNLATKSELEGKVDDSEISDMLTKTEAESTYAKKTDLPEEYTLPIASSDTLGGIKVGAGLSINQETGVLSTTGGGVADSVDWGNITSKPETFKPEAHQHTAADITDLQEKLDSKQDKGNYITSETADEKYALKTDLDSKVDDSEISDMLTKTEASSTYATKSELSSKQDTLSSGTNIKTINGNSILGSGDLEINTESITIDDTLSLESENPVQNKVISAKIQELDDIVNPLTITVSGGGLFEKGVQQTITVSWTLKKGQSTTTADSVTINDEPVEGNSKEFSNVSETTTYTVKATKGGKQVQGSTTATFVGPMYFGFAQESTVGELNISSLNKQAIKNNPAGSYTLNNSTSGHYLWLCIPQNMNINSVTSSGFTVPMESAETKELEGIDTYKCYRSSNTINSGDMKITIS